MVQFTIEGEIDLSEDAEFQAFVLYFLWPTLFCGLAGNRCVGTYMALLKDLSVLGEYAWGAAALSFLFHALDSRVREGAGNKALLCFAPILEASGISDFLYSFPSMGCVCLLV